MKQNFDYDVRKCEKNWNKKVSLAKNTIDINGIQARICLCTLWIRIRYESYHKVLIWVSGNIDISWFRNIWYLNKSKQTKTFDCIDIWIEEYVNTYMDCIRSPVTTFESKVKNHDYQCRLSNRSFLRSFFVECPYFLLPYSPHRYHDCYPFCTLLLKRLAPVKSYFSQHKRKIKTHVYIGSNQIKASSSTLRIFLLCKAVYIILKYHITRCIISII